MSVVNRQTAPHLRCGLCDEPISTGEATVFVDDERCHRACAREEAPAEQVVFECPRCGRELDDESLGLECCVACGEPS